MVRQTSIDAYNTIKNNGLLSKRRWEVYDALFNYGPLTATQIASKMPGFKSQSVGANVHARLGELRSFGVVVELGEVECPETGNTVILWEVTNKLPTKARKQKKIKCEHCDGKGYFTEQQGEKS